MKILNFIFIFEIIFSQFSLAQEGFSRASIKKGSETISYSKFLVGIDSVWQLEHKSSGESEYRNIPALELGFQKNDQHYSVQMAKYSSFSGNKTMSTQRDVLSFMLQYSVVATATAYGKLLGGVGLGAYQDSVYSDIYDQQLAETSDWQFQAKLGSRFDFQLGKFITTGPGVNLLFAKNFDPNPMFQFVWGVGAQF